MASSKKNILVADNDPDTLAAVRFHLKMVGYQVFTANNPTQAMQMLQEKVIHLAIIDLRLKNDRELEYSGLEVAEKVPKYIPFIIYTAFEDTLAIKKALGKIGAKDIIDKKMNGAASRLIDSVSRLFTSDVKVNFNLLMEGTVTCGEIADNIEFSSKELSQPSAEDICQILASLFHDAESIRISPLDSAGRLPDQPHSGSLVVLVQPRYKNGLAEKRVVKFGKKSEISKEKDCYNEIMRYLSGMRLAVLEETAFSRQTGGVIYTVIHSDWENFRQFNEYYNDSSVEQISTSLERFFSQTFNTIFHAAESQPINMATLYSEGLHLTPSKLISALEELRPGHHAWPYLQFVGIEGEFPNPVSWILSDREFRKFERVVKVCLCHGDLHSRNILVDSDGDYWLIDFARVGTSHALRDFVELETDIKFNLMNDSDLAELYTYERALLEPRRFMEELPPVGFRASSMDKSYKVISTLRQVAAKSLELEGDMREYYEALLFNTLKVLRLRHISACQKEYALLSASLLCMLLDRWPEWEM